jgi:hypothetical protein
VPLLRSVEITSASEDLQHFISVDNKKWAARAIQDRSTTLADEELVDFLNLAGLKTYACFRMAKSNRTYQMYIATIAAASIKTA